MLRCWGINNLAESILKKGHRHNTEPLNSEENSFFSRLAVAGLTPNDMGCDCQAVARVILKDALVPTDEEITQHNYTLGAKIPGNLDQAIQNRVSRILNDVAKVGVEINSLPGVLGLSSRISQAIEKGETPGEAFQQVTGFPFQTVSSEFVDVLCQDSLGTDAEQGRAKHYASQRQALTEAFEKRNAATDPATHQGDDCPEIVTDVSQGNLGSTGSFCTQDLSEEEAKFRRRLEGRGINVAALNKFYDDPNNRNNAIPRSCRTKDQGEGGVTDLGVEQ